MLFRSYGQQRTKQKMQEMQKTLSISGKSRLRKYFIERYFDSKVVGESGTIFDIGSLIGDE